MKKTIHTILLLAALLLGLLGCRQYKTHVLAEEIAGKLIRFHVRANSDAQLDQELKLKVRDAVGSCMQPMLSGVSDIEKSRKIIKASLPKIERTAEETIAAQGFSYPVTASLAAVEFPEKTYGSYTFPAGIYEALEVVIGEGKGQNWWCVMYPNMCFHGSVYEIVDEVAEKSLQQVLSGDEYDAVLKSGKYRVRFKYLDFLNRFIKD